MSLLAIPIAGSIATATAETGILATELLGTSLGTYIYGTAIGATATTIANKIENVVPITSTAQEYLDTAKAVYMAQQFQDPNIFLKNRGVKQLPENFTPNYDEKIQFLDEENVELNQKSENEILETKKNNIYYNYTPQDLLKVIYGISQNQKVQLQDIKTLTDNYKEKAPSYLQPLVDIVLKYTGDIDTNIKNNETYQKFKDIFNMKDIKTQKLLSVDKNYINENGNLYFIDELGKKIGPMKQGTETQAHIPELYGIYGGPLSRNFTKPVDIVDLAFFAHDVDFTVNNYLDYNSDIKLISRLNSLLEMNLVPDKSINLIKSIINYFSTAGLLLDKIRGTNTKIEDLSETTNDIFMDLRPELINEDVDINQLKKKFFVELENAKDDIQISSGVFDKIQSDSIINEIEYELENMEIQII